MRTEVDLELLGRTIQDLYRMKQGEAMSAIVHLGVRLGLFDALARAPRSASDDLADATDLHERWVREWLNAVAAAGLACHEEGRFHLTPEARATLCEPDHPAATAGVFGLPITHHEINRTAEAFETGLGMTWSEHGVHACHFQAAMSASGQRAWLVPVILDAVEQLTERLRAGATVVDVGCGAGVAAAAIAGAFPQSTVVGIDPSAHAIETATRTADSEALTNLSFRSGTFDDLRGFSDVDLLVTLDVLHDLPNPAAAAAAARSCLADDGVWMVADIKTRGGLEENRHIPVLPLMYAMSVLYCMSSAMSEPDGAGLGTLGLTVEVFEEMAAAAGFGSVKVHEFEVDPLNRYFEVRI